ncbi:30S ribosomal protein S3 [Candidatus Wolfebacteria bacterium CG10_big_fil_rev_8_21_14_0_10_31_9]|uniref:Small ribosomal subunit protein uS3 n=1 Tax=Candidatus Wolfebacteria bacterium CG10_big_fil_rev_8_21_14_0_10_31_9 TaxID=1975070 RepID=A0A2H0RC77_9BACT|nr:MAG: 30S ribosomal protein S3 [Candidatus Wolfebacteria bacterium CG10_big_fil_rev_8_21_14_0_10_31_9]
MGHKIKPTSLRIGIIKDWNSRWYPKKETARHLLEEDLLIRKLVKGKISSAGIDNLSIERFGESIKIYIRASKPGLIIGRGGKGIEDLTKLLEKNIGRLRLLKNLKKLAGLSLNIEELKRWDISAAVTAQNMANDIERRLPFRRVIKKALEEILQHKDVLGARVKVSGRLNGSEIARDEALSKGKIPLQTLRANIDYAEATAFTTYGTIGVKVWINKGEVFKKDNQS